jgi:hypothetical protein
MKLLWVFFFNEEKVATTPIKKRRIFVGPSPEMVAFVEEGFLRK